MLAKACEVLKIRQRPGKQQLLEHLPARGSFVSWPSYAQFMFEISLNAC